MNRIKLTDEIINELKDGKRIRIEDSRIGVDGFNGLLIIHPPNSNKGEPHEYEVKEDR